MAVFTVNINDQVFDRKSAEIAYLLNVLETVKQEIGLGRGTIMSGSIIGTNPAGTASTSLGSWIYTPSASKP